MTTMQYDLVQETDRLYMAIGRVVVSFQFVENLVGELLASLLKLREPNDAHRITASMSFRQKVDLFCDLYPARNSGMLPPIDIAITRKALLTSEEFRNSVVHSFWYVGESDSYKWMRSKSTLKTPKGFKITSGEANTACLESGAKAIDAVRDFYLGSIESLKKANTILDKCIRTISMQPS